eukprot:598773-Pyramimonas_sp.AAC.1
MGASLGDLPVDKSEQVPGVRVVRDGLFQRGRTNDFRGIRQCDASELRSAFVDAVCAAESSALTGMGILAQHYTV